MGVVVQLPHFPRLLFGQASQQDYISLDTLQWLRQQELSFRSTPLPLLHSHFLNRSTIKTCCKAYLLYLPREKDDWERRVLAL